MILNYEFETGNYEYELNADEEREMANKFISTTYNLTIGNAEILVFDFDLLDQILELEEFMDYCLEQYEEEAYQAYLESRMSKYDLYGVDRRNF